MKTIDVSGTRDVMSDPNSSPRNSEHFGSPTKSADLRPDSHMYINKQQLRPIEFTDNIRLGAEGDGGYVVPRSVIDRTEVLVSFGVSDDWTFEAAFKKKNPALTIEAYDPTVSYLEFRSRAFRHLEKAVFLAMLMRLKFARQHFDEWQQRRDTYRSYKQFYMTKDDVRHIRKWIAADPAEGSITPKEIFNRLVNEEGRKSLFLKMDIEGTEYSIVDQIAAFSQSIDCIVMECHEIDRLSGFNRLVEVLLKDYSIVHVHGNNISPFNENEGFPVVIEVTFLNNKFLEPLDGRKPSSQTFPIDGLDWPNTKWKPDIPLVFE